MSLIKRNIPHTYKIGGEIQGPGINFLLTVMAVLSVGMSSWRASLAAYPLRLLLWTDRFVKFIAILVDFVVRVIRVHDSDRTDPPNSFQSVDNPREP